MKPSTRMRRCPALGGLVVRVRQALRIYGLPLVAAAVALCPAPAGAAAAGGAGANDWKATVPGFAQKTEEWSKLTQKLAEHGMSYGALASSYRMLMFFSDLPLKEQAYRTIIRIIDLGYPYPTRAYFTTGDIEPKVDEKNYDFANSYYLYKAQAALDKGIKKWADSYMVNVDTENFIKYSYYQAIEAYRKKDLAKAEKLLEKVLSRNPPQDRYLSLIKKTARTLARIYFEEGQYARSYDIYRNFLLRMNPIEPNDWIEACWNLYYLKRYDEALGMLYNLESLISGEMINLEKYVLRALIYEDTCATDYMERLVTTFEKEFGTAITGIKTGKVLSQIPELQRIYVSENQDYYHLTNTLTNLQQEQGRISDLPHSLRELANYLYESEIAAVEKRVPAYAEAASQRAADRLIGFAESLRFIKFDVAKSHLGADEEDAGNEEKKKEDGEFDIRWVQQGDFWRDERLHYRAKLENRCVQ